MTTTAQHHRKPGASRVRLLAVSWLLLTAGMAGMPPAFADASPADHPSAAVVAAALGLPPGRVRILDQRPLQFVFLDGEYKIYTVRDLGSGETRDIGLDRSTGERVDPDALKARERELAASEGAKLAPDLRDLLLRHPELEAIEIRATFAGAGRGQLEAELARLGIETEASQGAGGPVLEAQLSARQIARLAQVNEIRTIELLADPVILDR